MSVQAIKLLLVEDSSVLAERICELLDELPEIELVGTAESESDALAELRKRRVHIVILDLHLKEGTGFGILRAIATMPMKPRVLVLTNHDSTAYQDRAGALGATRFLDKAVDFQRLPEVIKEIISEING